MVHHYWLVLLQGILFSVNCFMAPCALISHHGHYFNLFVSCDIPLPPPHLIIWLFLPGAELTKEITYGGQ